jgi:hypothetical protein
MIDNFTNILIAPSKVFADIAEKPRWFLPWLIISLLLASMQLGFYSLIEPDFLVDQLVEQSLQPGVSESDLRASMQGIVENINVLGLSSAIGIFFVLLITFAINSTYLYWIARLSEHSISFKTWYSLNAWCSVPMVFTVMATWLLMLTSGGLIELEAINPLNLNYLLLKSEGDYRNLLNSLNLISAWSVVLIMLGYKHITKSSYLAASLIVFTPYLLILLIWFLLIAL